MAAAHFIPVARCLDSKCTIHSPRRSPASRDCTLFNAWYWLKLYVLSYHLQDDGLRQTLAAELESMNYVQLTGYLCIIFVLHNDLEVKRARNFGNEDVEENTGCETCESGYPWKARTEWCDLSFHFIARYAELGFPAIDWQLVLEAWPEICHGEGNCKPRGKDKGTWEM